MPAAKIFRMPASVIILDLIGTLLLLVGGFDLMKAPLLGPLSRLTGGYGWHLVVGGGVSMLLGAGLLVSRLLAAKRASSTTAAIQTVERRAR